MLLENTPLTSSSENPVPFSLRVLKETLLKSINYYEKLANCNGTAMESLESSLRSICYILPGRFKDSEFVSEICKKTRQNNWKYSVDYYFLLLILKCFLY